MSASVARNRRRQRLPRQWLRGQGLDLGPLAATASGRHKVTHRFQLSETQQAILCLHVTVALGVGDDPGSAIQGQDFDVTSLEPIVHGLPHKV